MIRSAKQILRAFCLNQPHAWTDYLYLVEFCLNSRVNSSSGISPFRANFGFQPKVPASSAVLEEELEEGFQPERYLREILENFCLIKNNLVLAQNRM